MVRARVRGVRHDWALILEGHTRGTADVTALEARLGVALPPSYRSLLLVSDGIDEMLWPAAEVGWVREVSPERVVGASGYEIPPPGDPLLSYDPARSEDDIPPDYMPAMLQIGDYDGEILLNPLVQNDEGEWEAFHLGSWRGEVLRAPSFRDLWDDL
ncbi:hypothetical protein HerbRD11066_01110 [Herbidospora sp. RD11066]